MREDIATDNAVDNQ